MRRAGGIIALALVLMPAAARPTNEAEPVPTIVAPSASPAIEAFPRTFLGRLSIYQPNYFIVGTGGEPAAKFQLSFKYRVLTFGREAPDRPRPTLQLAYTQRSLWDLKGPSSPFFDTSYMPELFVESLKPPGAHQGGFSFLGWGAGLRHESNGRDGDVSRAINVAYARAILTFGSPESWYLGAVPEVWQYLGGADHMPHVGDYRGHGKAYFLVGRGPGSSLSWTVTPGDGFKRVTHELGLSIPVDVRKLDFATFIYVQYFDGYAESIRGYTHYSQSLRTGLSLVR
jgi:phospholipase A1/A2